MPPKYTAAQRKAFSARMKAKKARNTARRTQPKARAVSSIRSRAETKSRTHAYRYMAVGSEAGQVTTITDPTVYFDILNDDSFTFIPPLSVLSQTQGLGEGQMIGDSVYAKYLKMKLSLLYPYGPDHRLTPLVDCLCPDQIVVPCNQYLVHGWVKTPPNWSTFTNPVVINANRNDIKTFIIQRLKAYFDEREDKLKFIPQANTGFKILGYRKILNDRNGQFSTEASTVGHVKGVGKVTRGLFLMQNIICIENIAV